MTDLTTIDPDVEQRVAAGAAWLDTNYPRWVDLINLDLLDMSDADKCILGQIYGDFFASPLYGGDAAGLGFYVEGVFLLGAAYSALEAAWRDLITARRSA